MEKYRISVYNAVTGEDRPWWVNFLNLVDERMLQNLPCNYYDHVYNLLLNEYHARDIKTSSCIEFETEADFLIFKLKFS